MIYTKAKQEAAFKYLTQLLDNGKRVRIESLPEKRSIEQNRYMHGIAFAILGLQLGYTVQEVKELVKQIDGFKSKYFNEYTKNGVKFQRGTSDLTTKEQENFMSDYRMWCSQEHGCFIPLPHELNDDALNFIEQSQKYI
jgi:hypothetical protein